MGAAAFIMAELLQLPYAAVVVAAVIPSLLYYGTLFLCVDLEAAKARIGAALIENAPLQVVVWDFASHLELK
jgi:TRAP-type uncharacterized transport system fused permease subunit